MTSLLCSLSSWIHTTNYIHLWGQQKKLKAKQEFICKKEPYDRVQSNANASLKISQLIICILGLSP